MWQHYTGLGKKRKTTRELLCRSAAILNEVIAEDWGGGDRSTEGEKEAWVEIVRRMTAERLNCLEPVMRDDALAIAQFAQKACDNLEKEKGWGKKISKLYLMAIR